MHVGPYDVRMDYKSCGLCKFHRSYMVKSGRHPIYEHFCEHPKAIPDKFEHPVMSLGKQDPGRFIGENRNSTPRWCPVLSAQ